MTIARAGTAAPGWLHALAWVQGALIAVFAVLLLRGGDATPRGEPLDAAEVPASAAGGTVAAETVAWERPAPPAATAPPGQPPENLVPDGTVLYGRVRDPAGADITDGTVWFSRPGQPRPLLSLNLRPGNATFAIAGLAPGTVEYRTRVAGHRELRASIEIPAGTPRLRHDLVIEPTWVLAVKIVTPDGRLLHTALAEIVRERRRLAFVEVAAVATATAPDGDFSPTAGRDVAVGLGRWRGATGIAAQIGEGPPLPAGVSGVLEIDASREVWVSAVLRHRVLASAAVQPGQTEVALTVALEQVLQELGTIRGRVVDAATGAPVPRARVGFDDLQSGGMGEAAAADGRFELRDLRPGLLRMGIRSELHQANGDLVLLEPGQVLDLGDVPVAAVRNVRGRCEGARSGADQGRIAWTPLEPPWHPAVRQRGGGTTAVAGDGTFALRLTEGRYLIRAYGAGGAVVEVDTRVLGDEPLVLRLAPEAELRVAVQSAGEPWEMAVADAARRVLHRVSLRDGQRFPVALLPGDYRVELTGPGGAAKAHTVRLGPGGADLTVP